MEEREREKRAGKRERKKAPKKAMEYQRWRANEIG